MDFDEIVVKESPGLCRCCLSEGCYKDLSSEYSWMGETEIYADMLMECFDISVSQHVEGPNGQMRLICEVCITRLRDACNFKKQVQESEKKFVDMVGRGDFRSKATLVYDSSTSMKEEPHLRTTDALQVEYLDELDFGDDADDILKTDTEMEQTEDITATALPVKRGRGRPRKNPEVKSEKKKAKLEREEKPRTSKMREKGAKEAGITAQTNLTSTKRNRLMKKNAIIILESSTVCPFKWHRQNYLCFFCHKIFKNTEILKEHTKSEHKLSSIKTAVLYLRRDEKVKIDVSVISCRLCDVTIDDLTSLINHMKFVHKKIFNEEFGFGLIPYNLQEDRFQCAICKEQFQYFIKLNQHMNTHFGSYICEACGKSFLSQDRLRCHALSHGSGFRCKQCPETFNSLTQKTRHEAKIHQKQKLLKCFFCDATFQNYTQRKKHHKTKHDLEMPEFNCPVCGKAFQIMSKMKVHVQEVHVREKNFACSMCDQRFFSRTHVQKHMVKHFGERIHQCAVCNKSYARKQTLRDHMRIHNNDRRFSCSLCNQAFVQNNSLRLHMRVHHPPGANT